MYSFKNLCLATLLCSVILLATNCKNTKTSKMVTIPFAAAATGEYKYVGPDTLPDPKCTGALSAWRAIVDCKGSGAPIGNFTAHFDFCGDTSNHYGNVDACIVAQNGDSLFIFAEGQVRDGRLDEHPSYVTSYWQDTIIILGGTGKYKGVSGKILTNDYNSSEDPYTHHRWTGTIYLPSDR